MKYVIEFCCGVGFIMNLSQSLNINLERQKIVNYGAFSVSFLVLAIITEMVV